MGLGSIYRKDEGAISLRCVACAMSAGLGDRHVTGDRLPSSSLHPALGLRKKRLYPTVRDQLLVSQLFPSVAPVPVCSKAG